MSTWESVISKSCGGCVGGARCGGYTLLRLAKPSHDPAAPTPSRDLASCVLMKFRTVLNLSLKLLKRRTSLLLGWLVWPAVSIKLEDGSPLKILKRASCGSSPRWRVSPIFPGVSLFTGDQCALGGSCTKPIGWLSNAPWLNVVCKRCPPEHPKHEPLVGFAERCGVHTKMACVMPSLPRILKL